MRTVVLGSPHEPPRVAYSVGRPVGNAVTRNRVRRQLRAATRANADLLRGGSGYLVRARPGTNKAPAAELSSTLRAILTELSESAS